MFSAQFPEVPNICAICAEVAVYKCSFCEGAVYCSRSHQRSDWNNHKTKCFSYKVETSPQLGRYLTASKDLKAGSVVMTELPLVYGPKPTSTPESLAPCVGCYRICNLIVGARCVRCGWPICSRTCPCLGSSSLHALECLVLSLRPGCAISNFGDFYRHDALLPLRILMMQKRWPKKYSAIMGLQSHMEERKPGTETYEKAENTIVKYLDEEFLSFLRSAENAERCANFAPENSKELLHKICGIIDTNALNIELKNGIHLLALYPNFCLMENSCAPNTKHAFDVLNQGGDPEFKVTVKVVSDVRKGEHISTVYSEALWGTQIRRKRLLDTKYFKCTCDRCKDPTELGTNLSTMRCVGDGLTPCGGYQLPEDPLEDETEWPCDRCENRVKSNEVAYLIAQMGVEVDKIQMASPNVSQMEQLLSKLALFLHPTHYHMYSVKHSLIQLYGYQQGHLHHQLSTETIKRKIKYCAELLEVNKKLDPGNARLSLNTAVNYHELHNALFQFAKNHPEFSDGSIRKIEDEDLINIISQSKAAIEQAKSILSDGAQSIARRKLLVIINRSKSAFEEWALFYNISCCSRDEDTL